MNASSRWQYLVAVSFSMDVSGLIAESLLRTRSEAIIAADRDGVICFWNPGAERIFGYASREALGHSLDLIIPERLRNRHWQGFRGTVATGKSRYGEGDVLSVPASHKNGDTISIEFTIMPLRESSGAIIALVAIVRDVTKRFAEIRRLKQRLGESSGAKTATAPS
jgi:PAS domain S-box-containing protein